MRSIFIGAPGAGKGTQAKVLCAEFGIPHISTGDMLRSEIKRMTSVGQKIKRMLDEGVLVPDTMVNRLVDGRTSESDCLKGYVLDGYPRTVDQAKYLDAILEAKKLPIDSVFHFDVDEQELINRLLERAQKEGRPDDTAETIPNRIKLFREETQPILGYYGKKNLVHVIKAKGEVDEITESIRVIWKSMS